MFNNIYGYDPDVFVYGTAIKINDSHTPIPKGTLVSFESPNTYFRENLSNNYLVRSCYVTELVLFNVSGVEYRIPLHFINGENPRVKIEVLGK